MMYKHIIDVVTCCQYMILYDMICIAKKKRGDSDKLARDVAKYDKQSGDMVHIR